MNKLQSIKNKIYEACPESKELKMGCKFGCEDGEFTIRLNGERF